jgi:hypothetical protein
MAFAINPFTTFPSTLLLLKDYKPTPDDLALAGYIEDYATEVRSLISSKQ